MKIVIRLILLILISTLSILNQGAEIPVNLSLEAAYQKALEKEAVQAAQHKLQQSYYLRKQALGAALPQVSLEGSYTEQAEGSSASSSFRPSTKALSLELKQSLFKGFQEYAALRKTKNNIEVAQLNLRKTKSELLNDVAKSYVEVLYSQQDVQLKEELVRLSNERVDFLKHRVATGRSQQSEWLSAKSLAANAESDLSDSKNQLKSAQDNLAFLTGLSDELVVQDLSEKISLLSMEAYLQRISDSPDLKIEKESLKNSQEDLNIAKAGHWPKLDLKGDYYLERNGVYSGSDWAVNLTMSLPLFESGKTHADIKQAAESTRMTETQLKYKQEQIRRDVKKLYHSLQISDSQLQHFKEAIDINRKNYEAQKKQYQLSLITNLDVLQALTQYIQSRSRLYRLNANRHENYYRLITLLGDTLETH